MLPKQTSLFTNLSIEPSSEVAWRIPTELPDLTNVGIVALDTETTGLDPFNDRPVGLAIAYRDDKLRKMYLPFAHAEGNMDVELVKRWVRTELAFHPVVFANAKFDCHMMRKFGIDLEEIGIAPADIAFGAALLDDRRWVKLDLDTLGRQYVGEGKAKLANKTRIDRLPSWCMGPYAEQDASLTLRIQEAIDPLIVGENLERVLTLENNLIYPVCEIERNGCRIDVPKLERWQREVRKQYQAVLMQIYQATGLQVQIGSGDSLKRVFKQLGLDAPRVSTKSGKSAFTEKQLTNMKHPVVDLIVRARRLEGLLTRYLDKFLEGLDGDILRSQFHQLKSSEEDHGAISGRFSSSGSEDSPGYKFNAQQVITTEKQIAELGEGYIIRELFIPAEGAEYFACDAHQIEYRLFAHFSKAESVLTKYREDPTTNYHKLVLGLLRSIGAEIEYKHTKNVNFARLYGAGVEKIAKMIDMSKEDATRFLKEYDKVLPEAKTLMTQISKLAEEQGYVTTVLGRRARFAEGDKLHSALNRVIQGTAADLMKMKMRTIYRERDNIGITQLRQVVHDEQCGDKDPDPKYTAAMKECFNSQEVRLRVPILWDLNVGKTWKDCG